jgi:uncharacterized protein (DUF2235 family)
MKRIIACCDGTWNRPGTLDGNVPVKTNVQLIFECIPKLSKKGSTETKQLKFYETGVGSSTFDKEDQVMGGLSGAGIDKKIKDIYSFVVFNYQPGDEIYLFGFSRGAYTARSIAGFIRNCGILKASNIHLIDYAYDLYRDRNEYSSPDSDLMTSFRSNYCVEDITKIKFIGVWDTVGSLGLPLDFKKEYNMEKYKFHDVKLSSTIENAYHAIAIDEKRKLFEPTLWEISDNGINKGQKVEQRWFAGLHCNVGGSYKDTGLSDLALNWLIQKAEECGLEVNNPSVCNNEHYTFNPNYKGVLRDSMAWFYKIWFPKYREIGNEFRYIKAENGSTKKVRTNEVIDESVRMRLNDSSLNYRPDNLKDWSK